jgi:hypothetical protein
MLPVLVVFLSFPVCGAEFPAGNIRLDIDDVSGTFNLYSIPNRDAQGNPLPLLADRFRTSYMSVAVNGNVQKLDSKAFTRRLEITEEGLPAMIFDSTIPSMPILITMEFVFIRSPEAQETNGVQVSITLENKGGSEIQAGARLLLDTYLNEKNILFTTSDRAFETELYLRRDRTSGITPPDRFWIDKNETLSLTGSLFTGSDGDPDTVHVANWKRLNDALWDVPYRIGRNFNLLPLSVQDTAVAYYWDPRPLTAYAKRSLSLYLLLNSNSGMETRVAAGGGNAAPCPPLPVKKQMTDAEQAWGRREIAKFLGRIDDAINLGNATDEEIEDMEFNLSFLQAVYE